MGRSPDGDADAGGGSGAPRAADERPRDGVSVGGIPRRDGTGERGPRGAGDDGAAGEPRGEPAPVARADDRRERAGGSSVRRRHGGRGAGVRAGAPDAAGGEVPAHGEHGWGRESDIRARRVRREARNEGVSGGVRGDRLASHRYHRLHRYSLCPAEGLARRPEGESQMKEIAGPTVDGRRESQKGKGFRVATLWSLFFV